MPEQGQERSSTLAALAVLVGEWAVEVQLTDSPIGQATFAWVLNGQYLLGRSTAPEHVPDCPVVIALGDDTDPHHQPYFDSRRVTRLYRMGLANGVRTLRRSDPDLSPLDSPA